MTRSVQGSSQKGGGRKNKASRKGSRVSKASSRGSRASKTPSPKKDSKRSEKQAKRGANEKSMLERVSSILPRLDSTQRKGDSGRLLVIGGSKELALAAGFCSYAQVKSGADQSTVFLHPSANADLLRQRFMTIVVRPTHAFEEMLPALQKSNGVVIGPGLIGDAAAELPSEETDIEDLPKSDNVVTTPNCKEFKAFCAAFGVSPTGSVEEKAKRLARRLEMCVMVKGAVDTITDGTEVLTGDTEGSPRRTAGLGDMLAGITALFSHYAKIAAGREIVAKEDLLEGSQAASDLLRHACHLTYATEGRTMTVEEVLNYLVQAIKEAEPKKVTNQQEPARETRR